jgi:hypothetical protein
MARHTTRWIRLRMGDRVETIDQQSSLTQRRRVRGWWRWEKVAPWREARQAQRHGGEMPENGTNRERGGRGELRTSSK